MSSSSLTSHENPLANQVGRWDTYYQTRRADPAWIYGEAQSAQLCIDYLGSQGCLTMEDWGCGGGGLKALADKLEPPIDYIGVDGSGTPHAHKVRDLRTYRVEDDKRPDGIVLRHVLEHNIDWRIILANALASARKAVAVCFFVPPTIGPDTIVNRYHWHGEEAIELDIDVDVFERISNNHPRVKSYRAKFTAGRDLLYTYILH